MAKSMFDLEVNYREEGRKFQERRLREVLKWALKEYRDLFSIPENHRVLMPGEPLMRGDYYYHYDTAGFVSVGEMMVGTELTEHSPLTIRLRGRELQPLEAGSETASVTRIA